MFSHYPATHVLGNEKELKVSRQQINDTLTQLAQKENSLIARRIVEPSNTGKANFSYHLYGKGELPDGLKQATPEQIESSTLNNSYLIVQGSLSTIQLAETFQKMGYLAVNENGSNGFSFFLSLFFSGTFFIVLMTLLLAFTSIRVIYRLKNLNYAGIRLISGKTLLTIVLESIYEDIKIIFTSFILIVSGSTFYLFVSNHFKWSFIKLLVEGVFSYTIILLSISILLSCVYVIGLKQNGLMQIIKGKLPLKSLLSILLIGQLISVLAVGYSIFRLSSYYQLFDEQTRAIQMWSTQDNFYNLSFGGTVFSTKQERSKQNEQWHQYVIDAIDNHDAMLVQHNLDSLLDEKNLSLDSYTPETNTLFVTPNYLTNQNIVLSEEIVQQLTHLKEG